jgi:hypothetical protein
MATNKHPELAPVSAPFRWKGKYQSEEVNREP